jgi:hypothetical protein
MRRDQLAGVTSTLQAVWQCGAEEGLGPRDAQVPARSIGLKPSGRALERLVINQNSNLPDLI